MNLTCQRCRSNESSVHSFRIWVNCLVNPALSGLVHTVLQQGIWNGRSCFYASDTHCLALIKDTDAPYCLKMIRRLPHSTKCDKVKQPKISVFAWFHTQTCSADHEVTLCSKFRWKCEHALFVDALTTLIRVVGAAQCEPEATILFWILRHISWSVATDRSSSNNRVPLCPL